MKKSKIIIAIVLLVSISQFALAQGTNDNSKLKFGFKGGVNFSNLYTDEVDDNNVLTGFNAGIFAKLPITQLFAIQPELLYSTKGAKLTYNNSFANGTAKFKLNYIELPVLLVVNLTKNFNIHAGPYAAFLLSAKVQDVDKNGNINGATELNKDNFESVDYGIFGGVAFDVDNVTIGGRYTYGLREIGKSGLSGNLTKNSKNSAISFYIGFGF